jgi:hypothetical protein
VSRLLASYWRLDLWPRVRSLAMFFCFSVEKNGSKILVINSTKQAKQAVIRLWHTPRACDRLLSQQQQRRATALARCAPSLGKHFKFESQRLHLRRLLVAPATSSRMPPSFSSACFAAMQRTDLFSYLHGMTAVLVSSPAPSHAHLPHAVCPVSSLIVPLQMFAFCVNLLFNGALFVQLRRMSAEQKKVAWKHQRLFAYLAFSSSLFGVLASAPAGAT